MAEILISLIKWTGSKLLVLLGVLLILLIAYWFSSEWAEISKLLKETSAVETQITEKEGAIKKLRGEVTRLGTAAAQALKEIESLDKVAMDAHASAVEAKKSFEYWSSQVGPWQYAFEKWKVAEQGKAWGEYEAKNAAAITAQAAADAARKAQENSPWALTQAKIDAEQKEVDTLQADKKKMEETTATSPTQKLILAVREVLPTALWILLGVILFPPGIKAVLYFCVAPLADKVAPIKIVPGEATPRAPELLASGVSLNVEITGTNELLAHPDYLQSSAKSAKKLTKWFLNHRLPFSSLASGMCMLTRLRAEEGQSEMAKISATKDPFGEVALIDLPEGAAMVLYPRSLVAVVKPQGHEVAITRRWRLKSLHSWLTLQFRYLVFHGPCQIVVKGCRGVCVEKPVTEKPRLINQAATIGFSANLDYSNTRSEVFLSYFRGKDDLFNDLFGGENGVFIYEEMPDLRRKSGLTGRGLEGVSDTLLKIFGV